jgi:hypothetical protein
MARVTLCCRLCGSRLRRGLVATGRRACCLNATRIVGACPEHGPVGPHHAVEDGDEGGSGGGGRGEGDSAPESGDVN